MRTQKGDVLDYMLHNGSITSWQAITMFGATRLSDIIFRLKKEGYNITSQLVSVNTRYGKKKVSCYTLEA